MQSRNTSHVNTTDTSIETRGIATIGTILSNTRRVQLIETINQDPTATFTVDELVEKIVETEEDVSTPNTEQYKSCRVALMQRHLPRLDAKDVVEYNENTQEISVDVQFEEVAESVDALQDVLDE